MIESTTGVGRFDERLKTDVLRQAIADNNTALVRLLLASGFDCESGRDSREKSTMNVARKKSAIQYLLEGAIIKRIKESHRYMAPRRLIWNVKTQKDELVEYSFTASEL